MKLVQINEELSDKLKSVHLDSDLAELGFECKGHLCEQKGYEEFYERLWVWTRVEGNTIMTLVTIDAGNTNLHIIYRDLFIPGLV